MNVRRAMARLRKGDVLHMQIGEGGRVWWFERPHQMVPPETVAKLLAKGTIADAGDSLFPTESDGQSYRVASR